MLLYTSKYMQILTLFTSYFNQIQIIQCQLAITYDVVYNQLDVLCTAY